MLRLLLLLCGILQPAAALRQDAGVRTASVGDNVTLKCFYDKNDQVVSHFSWYQQTLGGPPEVLFSVYKHDRSFEDFHQMEKKPRYSVQRKEGVNHLLISDLHLSDSAMYFCGSSYSNMMEFGQGVFLSVKGADHKEIVQGPTSETVRAGDSVTLDCTVHSGNCTGEHNVYWFRLGSRQGVLHRDQWKNNSTPSGSESRSCVYHLQKMNLSTSDGGTYHCAVASCGEIVFGNGSQLVVQGDLEDQMRMLTRLSIVRTGTQLFFVTMCLVVYSRMRRTSP